MTRTVYKKQSEPEFPDRSCGTSALDPEDGLGQNGPSINTNGKLSPVV